MIVALCGYARSGKDTIAAHLPGWHRAAFADALKAACRPTLDAMGLDLSDPAQKEIARPILVEVGQAGRTLDPDYWLKRVQLPAGNVVLTDCRYLNECLWVMRQGGVIIRIHRPGCEPANDEERRSFAAIEARLELPVVLNDGTPRQAAERVLAIVNHG